MFSLWCKGWLLMRCVATSPEVTAGYLCYLAASPADESPRLLRTTSPQDLYSGDSRQWGVERSPIRSKTVCSGEYACILCTLISFILMHHQITYFCYLAREAAADPFHLLNFSVVACFLLALLLKFWILGSHCSHNTWLIAVSILVILV